MVKIFKNLKKAATGQESIKDAFSDFEKFQQQIQPFAFMPFDMIVKTDEAIDTLLAQREVCGAPSCHGVHGQAQTQAETGCGVRQDMMTYKLMKERVPDVGLARCTAALEDLKKAFPEASPARNTE